MPVKACCFDVAAIVATAVVAPRDNQERNDAADHVRQMKSGDAEEGRPN